MKNIVVFASGSGSNFQSIIDACESGKITARITGLLTNKTDIKALERASNHGIATKTLSRSEFSTSEEYVTALLAQLKEWKPDLIALAGYLQKIPDSVIQQYPERILNIHPSLLPKFGGKGYYGMHVHNAVVAAEEVETGCTVHLVNEVYDEGEILGQVVVDVFAEDSPQDVAERVLKEEHRLYPLIIEKHLEILD